MVENTRSIGVQVEAYERMKWFLGTVGPFLGIKESNLGQFVSTAINAHIDQLIEKARLQADSLGVDIRRVLPKGPTKDWLLIGEDED